MNPKPHTAKKPRTEPPRGYRKVPGFLGYAVTRKGAVMSCRTGGPTVRFSKRWHRVRLMRDARGYMLLHLKRNGRRVNGLAHRFVLLAFVGPCPKGKEACHNNGVHDDNRVRNLRWDTRSANLHDRTAHGYRNRSETRAAKLNAAKVRTIRASKESCVALGKRFKVHWKTISRVRHFHCWKSIK